MQSQNALEFVPIYGEFEITPEGIQFKGKRVVVKPLSDIQDSNPSDGGATEAQERAALGLLLSNVTLEDGEVRAEVEFETMSGDTSCELLVSYDPNQNHVVTAGLGGHDAAMFSIREYGGSKTGRGLWWGHRIGGERVSLRTKKNYLIEAVFRGGLVTLRVDRVTVATADVSSPTGRARQVGILCKSEGPVYIRNFRVSSAKPKAFVVMQFSGEFDSVYKDVIKEVCKNYDVDVSRADEVSGPGLIIADVVRDISESQLIIADITAANPNVYFEVGYAMALGKPTILLAKKGTPLPFDVAAFRVLFYEDTIGGKSKLELGLRHHLNSILSAP